MKGSLGQSVTSSVRRRLWNVKNAIASPKRVQKYMGLIGYDVAQKSDYYSPLTSVSELRSTVERWNRPSALAGISYDLAQMKHDLSDLLAQYLDDFLAIPPYEELCRVGYGPGYSAVDALTLYVMVRHLKPARYVEIGSGLSTYYCSLAAARNAEEGRPVAITCIEPNPYPKLYEIQGIQVIAKMVQDTDISLLLPQPGDMFFIDSSHVLKIDGDVPFLYLEVLPQLSAGVVIHIHDVPFPYNIPYPPKFWVFGRQWPMLWNEAMVVQAFLCGNRDFKMLMSTPLIRHFDEPFLKSRIPFYESIDQNPNTFSSLWLTKVA